MPEVVIDDPGVVIDPAEDWSTRVHDVNRKYASYAQFVYAGTGAASWEGDFSAGINVVASRNITLANNDISMHTACIQLRNQATGVRVEGNVLHHCLDALKGARRATDAYSFSHSTIRANRVEQIFREGIRLTDGAQHSLVEDNRVEYTGHSHIVTYHAGGHNTIRRNQVQYGGYYTETMRFPGSSGISLHSAGPGTVADGNHIAYQVDATLRDGNGIIIDYTPEQARVVNNVIHRPMGSGITSMASGHASIVHNTIVEAGHGTTSLKNGVGIRIVQAGDVGNVIANNIIHLPHNGGISFEGGNLANQAYVDHNLFHVDGVPLVGNGLDPSAAYWSLASLQAAGHGLQSLQADPMLAVPAHGSLQPASPALAAGTPQHSVAHDAANHQRSASAPSIGAFESAGGPTAIVFASGYDDISDAQLADWIYYEGGNTSQRYARIAADPDDAANAVLHFWLNEAYIPYGNGALKGRIQASMDGAGRREMLIRQRLRLHEDMSVLVDAASTFSWLTIQEFWNDAPAGAFPFRVSVNIVKPDVAPGLRLQAHGQTKVPGEEAWDDVWSVVGGGFEVPVGEWMTVETYFREGNADGGRFSITVTDTAGVRHEVIAVTGFTHHPADPAPNGLDQINPLKLYAPDRLITPVREASRSLQLYWDDVEIRAEQP